MENLPSLDTVFVGGSGGELAAILSAADEKLKNGGRIVLNAVTIQTATMGIEFFRRHEGYRYTAVNVQVTRLRQVGGYDMNDAQNPVWIITAEKE